MVDMGMMWRFATPTAEERDKGDSSPYTWDDYTHKIVSMVLARHADATTIICVNDPYNKTESIKDDELGLRIQGKDHISNVFMKSGDEFPSANDFKTILCSDGNKARLQLLVKAHLSRIAQSIDQVLVYSVGEDCVSLKSGNIKNSFACRQCEADTIMLSIYASIRSSGNTNPVVIVAEDTGIYVQAPSLSHNIQGVLCIKKKKDMLFCRGMCDENTAKALISFHVMTGCDANSVWSYEEVPVW